jgi:hypothetical protein
VAQFDAGKENDQLTVGRSTSEGPRSLTHHGRYSMSDDLAGSTTQLEQLVTQIMKETDPVKYDDSAPKSGELSANANVL